MGDKNSFVLYMDLLSVLDELDDEETAMLFRAIRAYNQLERKRSYTDEGCGRFGSNDGEQNR